MSKKLVANLVRASSVLAASVVLITANACSRSQPSTVPSPNAPLPRVARLISITPSLTETICDLGLTSQLIARTANDDYPPEILNLPQIGDIQPNYEAMLALNPDAVLLDTTTASESLQQRLSELGLRLVTTKIDTLHDLCAQLPSLGQQLGCQEQALILQKHIEGTMVQLQKSAAALPRHPRVYLDLYHQPLMTAGKNSLMQELLELAGGINVFGDIDQPYPQIDAEDLLLRQPDIVVLTSISLNEARRHPIFGKLAAIKAGRALEVPPSLIQRPTLRGLKGAQLMQQYFSAWSQVSVNHGSATKGSGQNSPLGKGFMTEGSTK